MARTLADYVEDARLQIPLQQRPAKGDVENVFVEALKQVSFDAIESPYRAFLEVTVTLTLSTRDGLSRQTVSLPTSSTVIIAASIREGDVTHSDLTDPLLMRPISELTYVYSGSNLGYFAIDEGKVYCFKQGTAFAVTSNALSVRGVKLMQVVGDVPLEVEPYVVLKMVQMVMQPMGAAA